MRQEFNLSLTLLIVPQFTFNELVSSMHFRQTALDEVSSSRYNHQYTADSQQSLLSLHNAFGQLKDEAQAARLAQELQAEAQLSLHDQIQVAHGLLADITTSAISLRNAVEDTSSKIAHMASVGGVTGSIMRWAWMVLIIFVLYQFNPRIASYLATAFGEFTQMEGSDHGWLMPWIGAFLLLTTYGIFDKIGSLLPDLISDHDIENIHVSPYVLLAAVTAIGVIAILGVILHRFRKAQVDDSSKLPFLE